MYIILTARRKPNASSTPHRAPNAISCSRDAYISSTGALELARLLEYGRVARRIETQVDACRRDIEADSGGAS